MVSAFSVVASLLVPIGLLLSSGWLGVILAVLGIQLRLLANVLDGLVAVEGGKGSPIVPCTTSFLIGWQTPSSWSAWVMPPGLVGWVGPLRSWRP